MPVSTTLKATAYGVPSKPTSLLASTCSATEPRSVNFIALDSRLRRICCSRCSSVNSDLGAVSSASIENARPRSSATGRNARSTACEKRLVASFSLVKACSVRMAPISSAA